MNKILTRGLATATAACVLTASLAAGPVTAQVTPLPSSSGGNAGTFPMPDVVPGTKGLVIWPSDTVVWGSTEVIDNPSQAEATQVGPQGDLCRIGNGAFSTYNKGNADTGSFVVKPYTNNENLVVSFHFMSLAAKERRAWSLFPLDLKEGMNTVRVVFDANKQVAESDENNTFHVRFNVKIDCDGDGRVGGIAVPGGLNQAPDKSDPDPRPTRRPQRKSAN